MCGCVGMCFTAAKGDRGWARAGVDCLLLQVCKGAWRSDWTALCHLRTLHGEQGTHGQPNLADVHPLMLEFGCLWLQALRKTMLSSLCSESRGRDFRHATVLIPTQSSLIMPG